MSKFFWNRFKLWAQQGSRLPPLILAVGVLLACVGFFLPAILRHQADQEEIRRERAVLTAERVAWHLDEHIGGRLKLVEAIASLTPVSSLDSLEAFRRVRGGLELTLPGWLGITRVDTTGRVLWVSPEQWNPAARGQMPLLRPDTGGYMTAARQLGQGQLTHIIPLYQGSQGVVITQPVFMGGAFAGWINAVFALPDLMNEVLAPHERSGMAVRITMPEHPQAEYWFAGRRSKRWTEIGQDVGSAEVSILNQRFLVEARSTLFAARGSERLGMPLGITVGIVTGSLLLAYLSFALARSRARLARRFERMQIQSVLLNLLVHDITNPLLAIRLGLEQAVQDAPTLPPKSLDRLRGTVDELQAVVSRVRELRALELGKMTVSCRPTAAHAIIAKAVALFESRATAKGIAITVKPMPSELLILVDPVTFLHNVLCNILSNAIKFSNRGATITLAVEACARGGVTLEVVDQGIGMPDAIRQQLFRRRGVTTRRGTAGEAGTGLGMMQVGGYMKLFGGRVSVKSWQRTDRTFEHGTKVSLWLPSTEAAIRGASLVPRGGVWFS